MNELVEFRRSNMEKATEQDNVILDTKAQALDVQIKMRALQVI